MVSQCNIQVSTLRYYSDIPRSALSNQQMSLAGNPLQLCWRQHNIKAAGALTLQAVKGWSSFEVCFLESLSLLYM